MGKIVYANMCTRWVPKMLTETHKQNRVESARVILDHFFKAFHAYVGRRATLSPDLRPSDFYIFLHL